MRGLDGASGAKKWCALDTMGRGFWRPLNFTVRSLVVTPRFWVTFWALLAAGSFQAAVASELDAQTLSAAENKWSDAQVHTYDFTFDYGEFIAPCLPSKFHFMVVRDAPAHRERRCLKLQAEFGSVPLLFKFLDRALAASHNSIDAEFDPTYGFPRRVYIDWSGLTDDFETFTVSNFHAD